MGVFGLKIMQGPPFCGGPCFVWWGLSRLPDAPAGLCDHFGREGGKHLQTSRPCKQWTDKSQLSQARGQPEQALAVALIMFPAKVTSLQAKFLVSDDNNLFYFIILID